MINQPIPGIYVYQADDNKRITFTYFETIDHFLSGSFAMCFTYGEESITKFYSSDESKRFTRIKTDNEQYAPFPKYVYDDLCNIFTTDNLVGLYRAARTERYLNWHWSKYYISKRDRGQKNRCYGHFRRQRTFSERKQYDAFDDKEYNVRGRAGRNLHNLPDPWDDYYTRPQKCWKRQRKTRHQWRVK